MWSPNFIIEEAISSAGVIRRVDGNTKMVPEGWYKLIWAQVQPKGRHGADRKPISCAPRIAILATSPLSIYQRYDWGVEICSSCQFWGFQTNTKTKTKTKYRKDIFSHSIKCKDIKYDILSATFNPGATFNPQQRVNFCPIELKSLDYMHVLYFR